MREMGVKEPRLGFMRDHSEEPKEGQRSCGATICFKGDQKQVPWAREQVTLLTTAEWYFQGIWSYLEPHK